MDCHWCEGGRARLTDEDIVRQFDEALANENEKLFDAAMDDLMHSLYHKARRLMDHDAAMDVVLDSIKRLWGWWRKS